MVAAMMAITTYIGGNPMVALTMLFSPTPSMSDGSTSCARGEVN